MGNQFLNNRVIEAKFTISAISVSTQLPSGVFLPKDALVTGVTLICPASNVTANISQTYAVYAGSTPLVSAKSGKEIPAVTVASRPTLVATAGVYVPAAGEINIQVGSWDGTSVGHAEPTVFVGYIA
jgi:hypothetical protein